MRDVNKIILIGRLGKDPVQKETKNGVSVVNFPVATSRKFLSENAEAEDGLKEETQWHRVIAWGKQGEHCAQYLKKGQTVYVEGMVRTRTFKGKEGEERIAFEVHAENVSFLASPRRESVVAEAVAQ